MVQLYSSTDTTERSDFHMIDILLIAVHAFPMSILTTLSADEILLPRYGLLMSEICHLKVVESLRGVMTNVLYCDIVVSEFELQLQYYARFWTNALVNSMKPLIPLAIA